MRVASGSAMDDSSHSCAQVSMDESRTRFDKVQEEEPESWEGAARIYEYGSAANPELPKVPVVVHPASLHESGATRVIPFDLSELLGGQAPASPNLDGVLHPYHNRRSPSRPKPRPRPRRIM